MKPRYLLILSVMLLVFVIVLMTVDLFYTSKPNPDNPFEYDISKFKEIDESSICYQEITSFKPQSEKLYAVAIDANDYVYVSGLEVLFIYDNSHDLIKTVNLDDDAYCITVSESGLIYVGMADHVEVWNTSGELLKKWESMGGEAIFTSIAVNEESVFVADAGNKIVYHYNHDGELQNTIGEKNTKEGKLGFILPSAYFDLLIGRIDELWVVNPGIHQFESYRPNGELISSWKKTSMQWDGFSGCCNPSHIAMLSDGSFVTSEKGIERVKIHSQNGDFKCAVAIPDQFIEGTVDLDLAVDSEDRIYISDPKKGLIRVFAPKSDK